MKNILVVDNDRVYLLLISRFLQREGHRVVTANGGLEAIDILKTEVPDIIFLDMVMPHIDGKTLCAVIRGMENMEHTPIVVVSATAMENRNEIAQIGANACIVKTTLKETAGNILSIINTPDLSSFSCENSPFMGEADSRPQNITRELLSLKKHFEAIFDKMSEGVLEVSSEGRVLYANKAAVSMCGASGNGLLGRFFLEVFSGESLRKMAFMMDPDRMKRSESNRKTLLRMESKWIEVDGMNVEASDYPTTVLILHDITHRVKAEESLRTANEKLVREIEERVQLQGQLVRFESLAATGRLAASVAHEINSPLQAISAMLSNIADNHSADESLMRQLDLLRSAYGSIRDTVRNLLDLSRPQSHARQPVNINETIEKTAELSRSLITKGGVGLELSLSPDLPHIHASPQQIGHLVLNLINNAAEAMTPTDQSQSATTETTPEKRKIRIGTCVSNNTLEIEVADNGPGIPEGDERRIFDPFYTRKKKLGMGVGLANCLRIAENHNGTIRAANHPNGGAVFTITIPVDREGSESKEVPNEGLSIIAGG